jgi:hypothetical protein
MTREQWVMGKRDKLNGIMLDCVMMQKTGGELALALRGRMKEIDALLASYYDELTELATKPKSPPPPPRK